MIKMLVNLYKYMIKVNFQTIWYFFMDYKI